LLLLDNLSQFIGQRRYGLPDDLHLSTGGPANNDVDLAEGFVFVWKILPEMAAAAFFALDRRSGDCLGDGQQILKIHRGMPTRVVFTVSVSGDILRPLLEA